MRQDKLATSRRHSQRLCPWVKLLVLNDLENAANPKIVIANRSRTARITLQFGRCGLQRLQAITQSGERLPPFFVHRSGQDLLRCSKLSAARRPAQKRSSVPYLCVARAAATGEDERGADNGDKRAHINAVPLIASEKCRVRN